MLKFLAAASIVMFCAAPASAMTFLYSGKMDSYTIQESGTYSFTVAGAQGGYNPMRNACCGGGGALISGDIYLDAGEVLTILSGGAGNLAMAGDGGSGGSGGGMSFLSIGRSPLIVAAGGSGGSWGGAVQPGSPMDGQIESGGGFGGPAAAWAYGGSGAGWMSDGAGSTELGAGQGGYSWDGAFAGGDGYMANWRHGTPGPGVVGGFGGGGGSGYSVGGGGGGYSGGSSGHGGGSFIDASASNIEAIAGGNFSSGNPANGYVTLDFMGFAFAAASIVSAAPEPGTWAMFLLGFGAVGYALRLGSQRRAQHPL